MSSSCLACRHGGKVVIWCEMSGNRRLRVERCRCEWRGAGASGVEQVRVARSRCRRCNGVHRCEVGACGALRCQHYEKRTQCVEVGETMLALSFTEQMCWASLTYVVPSLDFHCDLPLVFIQEVVTDVTDPVGGPLPDSRDPVPPDILLVSQHS